MECSVLGQLRSGESTLATRKPWNQRQLIEDEHPPWREHPNKQSTSCHGNRGIGSTLLRTSHQARHKQRRFRLKHDSDPSQRGCQGAPKLSCQKDTDPTALATGMFVEWELPSPFPRYHQDSAKKRSRHTNWQ